MLSFVWRFLTLYTYPPLPTCLHYPLDLFPRYILKNLLFKELETKKGIKQWTPKSISRRVLSILDQLLTGLRSQSLPSYIFTGKNLLLQDDALEEDYVSDGDILEHYMRQLYHDGGKTDPNEIDILSVKDQLEYVRIGVV